MRIASKKVSSHELWNSDEQVFHLKCNQCLNVTVLHAYDEHEPTAFIALWAFLPASRNSLWRVSFLSVGTWGKIRSTAEPDALTTRYLQKFLETLRPVFLKTIGASHPFHETLVSTRRLSFKLAEEDLARYLRFEMGWVLGRVGLFWVGSGWVMTHLVNQLNAGEYKTSQLGLEQEHRPHRQCTGERATIERFI